MCDGKLKNVESLLTGYIETEGYFAHLLQVILSSDRYKIKCSIRISCESMQVRRWLSLVRHEGRCLSIDLYS